MTVTRPDSVTRRKRRQLADLAVQEQRRTAEHAEEDRAEAKAKANRAERRVERAQRRAERAARVQARRDRVAKVWRAALKRLRDDQPLLFALAMSGLCLTVTVAGQVMVYTSLDWHGWSWIGRVLPLIVEGAAWTFAGFAAAAVARGFAHARYTRLMWAFAFYAAGSNTYHFAVKLNDVVTGALLGGASIVGPLIWHTYLGLAKTVKSGRSAAQIKAALLRRIYFPVLSIRASRMWAAAGGVMDRDQAWQVVWTQAKGSAPGAVSFVPIVVASRNKWLFRLAFGRITAEVTATGEPPSAAAASADQRPDSTNDQRSPSAGNEWFPKASPALVGAWASAGDAPLADENAGWVDELERWVHTQDQRADEHGNEALTGGDSSTSDGESVSPASATDQRGTTRTDQRAASAGRRRWPRRKAAKASAGKPDYRALVKEYFEGRISAGARLDDITGPDAARATGASKQHARNILAELKRDHLNQGNQHGTD